MTQHGSRMIAHDLDTLFELGAIGRLTDRQLLTICVNPGSEGAAAFEVLVARHGPMVWGVCKRALANSHDAEDAFQATFLILLKKARLVHVQDSLGRWLYGVSLKVASRARQVAARRQGREVRLIEEPIARDCGATETRELECVIDQEVARLPTRYREAVILCDLQGLSYDEAARQLACPPGTVKSRLARGREKLEVLIARRGYGSLPLSPLFVPTALERMTLGLRSSGSITESVVTLTNGVLQAMFLTKLKIAGMGLIVASCVAGLTGLRMLPSAHGNDQPPRARVSEKTPEIPPPSDNELATTQSQASVIFGKPWETTVRIKAHHNGSIGFGSGTVVFCDQSVAWAVTTLHQLTDEKKGYPKPKSLQIDIFDGRLSREQGATTSYLESFECTAISANPSRDLALVQFRPGRKLKVSPIVPSSWQAERGMPMVTAGCSEGRDASFWSTTIVRILDHPASIEGLVECRYAPKQRRSGGGLFTTDGFLAGFCRYSDPSSNTGQYEGPAMLREMAASLNSEGASVGPTVLKTEPPTTPETIKSAPTLLPVAVETKRERLGSPAGSPASTTSSPDDAATDEKLAMIDFEIRFGTIVLKAEILTLQVDSAEKEIDALQKGVEEYQGQMTLLQDALLEKRLAVVEAESDGDRKKLEDEAVRAEKQVGLVRKLYQELKVEMSAKLKPYTRAKVLVSKAEMIAQVLSQSSKNTEDAAKLIPKLQKKLEDLEREIDAALDDDGKAPASNGALGS